MARSEKILTPVFRTSFPNAFAPRHRDDGTPQFGIVMLFRLDEDLSEMKRIASEVVKEEWGDKPPANLRSPFRDQGEKSHLAGYQPGAIFVSASSKRPPGVVSMKKDQNGRWIPLEDSIGEMGFYPGCWAWATVHAFTYKQVDPSKPMRPGVTFGLGNIQKTGDDTPLGGGSSPEDDFGSSATPNGGGAATGTDDDLPW